MGQDPAAFRTPDLKEGEYRTSKSAYSPKVKAHIEAKYPNAEIINERFL